MLLGAVGCLGAVLVAAWSSNLVLLSGWLLPLLLPGAAGCLHPVSRGGMVQLSSFIIRLVSTSASAWCCWVPASCS